MKSKMYKLLIPLLLSIILVVGCKDECSKLKCLNGGTCNDGKCSCPEWIEGSQCETETREKFYGVYVGTITGGGQTQNASATLETFSGNFKRIKWDTNQYFELSGSNSFDIPLQYSATNSSLTFSGSGSLSGNQLMYNLIAVQGGQTVVFNFSGTK